MKGQQSNEFDTYIFIVGEHWGSALINGDESGLSDAESAQLTDFITATTAMHGFGHWDGFGEADSKGFCRCEITGLMEECTELRLHVRKKR